MIIIKVLKGKELTQIYQIKVIIKNFYIKKNNNEKIENTLQIQILIDIKINIIKILI